MALDFVPPPSWLIQQYMQRKQPAEIANEGVQGALQTYAATKQQQQAQQLAQESKDIELAKLSTEGGSNAIDTLNAMRRARGQAPLTLPSTSAPVAAPALLPMSGPTPMEDAAQQSLPNEHPISPLVQASLAAGHGNPLGLQMPPSGGPTPPSGKPVAPDLGSDPALQEFNQIGSRAYQQKYGTKGLEKVKTALEIQKGLQDKAAGAPKFLTADQFDQLPGMKGKGASVAATFPQGQIPENYASLFGTGTRFQIGQDTKTNEFDTNQLGQDQKAYNTDDNVKKARGVLDKVNQAQGLLQAGTVDNATAKQALQTAMAYMATGGMRVNEVEMKQFGGAQTFTNHIGQLIQKADAGTLTPRDAKDMQGVLAIFKKSANESLRNAGMVHASQHATRTGAPIDQAYKRVTGMDMVPADQSTGSADAGQPGGEETKTINGQSFVKRNGQWFHQ